jgi:hypothetical protein
MAAIGTLALAPAANATPILVAGPSPAAPFAGTLIDFEGFSEGTLINSQYAGQGVSLIQPDGGSPQIDNFPGEYGFGLNSGVGMLTGSMDGGAPVPTIAPMKAVFSVPTAKAAAFMSDTAPLADYVVTAFDASGNVVESQTVAKSALPSAPQCGGTYLPAASAHCGIYVGFTETSATIKSIQFGPCCYGDSFAIDDVLFVANTPPTASVVLTPSKPTPGRVIKATVTASDPDGDPITLTYVWKLNGVVQRTVTKSAKKDNYDEDDKKPGDVVSVTVTPADAAAAGAPATASVKVIRENY